MHKNIRFYHSGMIIFFFYMGIKLQNFKILKNVSQNFHDMGIMENGKSFETSSI